ncbi:hypothetical protein BJ875DRAFT_222465 [Amylocarpus encephaloides]|uniref:GIY-YIG domain-containing protein n=1 Tax=Amylocarpus encephaloides TaxID=45428 RepID=A0A9P7YN13_9HELO|nr:hypothetical protein BJ875DRAFT_222465 [Amylocarpus encephaloides]
MPMDRPIPAFYCCYLLRSTVSRGSVYVGSTPNPIRRLKQHNGLSKGGAVRTARHNLRPWEMACIVTGFPSHVAALQFEWAWQNPHITSHIAPEERISRATQKKRSGHPRRAPHSVASLLANLHVLLRSPSFSRWPLDIRFFSKSVHESWVKWTKAAAEPVRRSIPVLQAFPSTKATISDSDPVGNNPGEEMIYRRMATLPITYDDQKSHVAKTKDIVDFELEGTCDVCLTDLEHDGGLYILCPNTKCDAIAHMTCLSKQFLEDGEEELVPIKGNCPKCKTELVWADLVKELSLRMRGQKEVEKLLKVKRAKKGKTSTLAQTVMELSSVDEDSENESDMEEEIERMEVLTSRSGTGPTGGDWHARNDFGASDTESVASNTSEPRRPVLAHSRETSPWERIIEDSDWDNAEVLD